MNEVQELKRMKLLIVSTSIHLPTGYANVSYNIIKTLAKDYQITHYGFQKHPHFRRPAIKGTLEYDASSDATDQQKFGFKELPDFIELIKPDVVLIYNDTSIINGFLNELYPEASGTRKPIIAMPKIWVYLDQVYKGTNRGLIDDYAEKVFVFSKYWKQKESDIVLSHAGNPQKFGDSLKLCKELKISPNKEIFLNINRNTERKRLDLTIQAFKLYHTQNPNSHLILVTAGKGYYDIPVVCSIEKIDENSISFIDTDKNYLPDEKISEFYSLADYGINTANGEGFGLSTLEHAMLGKPQIVLDLGSFRDFLTDETAVILKPTIRTYIQNQGIGYFSETTTAELVAEGMDSLKDKKKPVINITWEDVVIPLRLESSE